MATGPKDAPTQPLLAPELRRDPRGSPGGGPAAPRDAAHRRPSPPSASPSPSRARFLSPSPSPASSLPPSPRHRGHRLAGVAEEDAGGAPAAADRRRSLSPRFAGDMSHRPLDMLRAGARSADRHARRHGRRRSRASDTDSIDALDASVPGGPYHHGGPYDAALASRNLDAKYSPLAAVRDSTLEALRATPRENILDSLLHHVPLQGTASIPPGGRDLDGNVMQYDEGADLMREPDAAGGAYKRWPHMAYHPDDLKGKGESYTLDRDRKARKHRQHLSVPVAGPDAYEMLPHQRRASDVPPDAAMASAGHLSRRHSTGRRLSEGIKRRFGSFRHRKA